MIAKSAADAEKHEHKAKAEMNTALIMFLAFVAATLGITDLGLEAQPTGASAYFAAGRSINGWQNGFAVAEIT